MSDDIGGFFVNLGVKVDNSIDKGIGKITDMTNSLSRLIGTVRNVSAASLALAGVTGVVEQEVANSAALLNTTSDVVKMWRFAVDETGASGKAFISTLTGIESKIQDVKKGVVDEGLATALSRLGINMLDFANMEMTERVKLIFDKADLIEDKKHARDLVGDILGAEGQKFYINLETQGKNLNEVLSSAKNHIFTDIESQSNAMMFNSEIKALKNMIGEITSLTGSELGEVFAPMVKGLNEFLEANNELIASGIKDTFEDIRDILNQLAPAFDKTSEAVGELIKSLTNSDSVAEGLNKIKDGLFEVTKDFTNTILATFSDLVLMINAVMDGEWKKAGQYALKFYDDYNKGVVDMLTPESEQDTIKQAIRYQEKMEEIKDLPDYRGTGPDYAGYMFDQLNKGLDYIGESIRNFLSPPKPYNPSAPEQEPEDPWWRDEKINDGIVKPNGQVISISPDDWVFAMKDPSNLAKGINGTIPQNAIDPSFIKSVLPRTITGNTNTINENITVNQTFNVQGGGNLPQTIRQQAQKGVYDGVGELIQKSTTRLQLMSGIK